MEKKVESNILRCKIKEQLHIVRTDRITNGGAVIATLGEDADDNKGKKVFVWGALPNELVKVCIYKEKSKYCEAYTVEVLEASQFRESVLTDEQLASTPWLCYNFDYENTLKKQLVKDAFRYYQLEEFLPKDFKVTSQKDAQLFYRNKYRYGFLPNRKKFGVIKRSSNEIIEVDQFSLPDKQISQRAQEVLEKIKELEFISPEDLDSLLIRSSQTSGMTVARLYLQTKSFSKKQLQNLPVEEIYFRPQNRRIENATFLLRNGSTELEDQLFEKTFRYNIDSFFQGNKAVFELFLEDLNTLLDADFLQIDQNTQLIDFYSGIGSIGLSVKRSFAKTVLVDTNKMNVKYATKNLQVLGHNKTVEVISADVAKVTELIKQNSVLIVDPPRNGLSKKVVEKIIEIRPKHIAYLSCDPVTQARDIALIMQNKNYQIDFVQTYNFFPRTAHIENFVFLSVHL